MNASRRVAVVGAGWFAGFHLDAWREAGAEVVGLADLDLQRAQAQAARHGIATVHSRAEALIDSTRPELVDVVLPPAAQAEVVRLSVARGLPTICQKPFGHDWADALAMTERAEAARTMLVVHENFRFMPWFRECRRLIDAGFFGRVHGATFRLRPGDGQGPNAYLDRQPYFQKMPQLLVRETAIHFIDTLRFLLGEVREVSAHLRRLNPVIAGEDAALIHFTFDDSRTAVFDGNRLNGHVAADPRRTMGEFWLEGEAGVMRLDGDARLWWLAHGARSETPHTYGPLGDGAFGGAVTALHRHVLAHLDTGTPLENTARDYLDNLRVQEAVYRAHSQGRRIELATFVPAVEGDLP